jgi:uncharacterized protein (TIGR02271 family)
MNRVRQAYPGSLKGDMARAMRRVIPIVTEEALVQSRRRVIGRVRVAKIVRREERTITQPVNREDIHIKRVPVKRFVDQPAPVRHEGETTIVPLIEEVPVVVTQLFLREELHITKRRTAGRRRIRVTLRREEPQITRIGRPRHLAGESPHPTERPAHPKLRRNQ